MAERVTDGAVVYRLRRARKHYHCDGSGYPHGHERIGPGVLYLHLTALPGHDVAPAWDVHRVCSRCARTTNHPFGDRLPFGELSA